MRRPGLGKGDLWSGRQAGGAAETIGDANITARVRSDIPRHVEDQITREPQWITGSIS
jgi:hypothetical protein